MAFVLRSIRASLFGLSLVGVSALSGCGNGTTSVSGKVTAGGKPVVWGSVILVDAKGAYHQGDIDLTGKYTVSEVPVGNVKIGVTSPNPDGGHKGGGRKAGGKIAADDPREKFMAEQGLTKNPEKPHPPAGAWFALPPTATDPMSSGLTGEVVAGRPLDIDVK